MGAFFDALKIIGNGVKEIAQEQKEKPKKSAIDIVDDILKSEQLEGSSFDELLKNFYEIKMISADSAFIGYASGIILMRKYQFYDPYYFKQAKAYIWKLKKTDKLNLSNIELDVIEKYLTDFDEYSQEKLESIVTAYNVIPINTYNFKDSTYYYTVSCEENSLINHYAAVAACKLLLMKYEIERELDDLSETNDDDMREKRFQERMTKSVEIGVKLLGKAIDKYVPDDESKK